MSANNIAKDESKLPYLAKINNLYMPLIEQQFKSNDIVFNEYSKRCVLNAMASINQVLDVKGIKWSNPQLDQSNLTQTLLTVASLELNSAAEPRECYFQVRNVKKQAKDKDGKPIEVWNKVIEMGIEGDGNDAILARFGRDVKKVYPYWLVREGDDFTYPTYNGITITPPQWTPKGNSGKVVRIVYPILHKDNTIHYYIGEREDVVNNLVAHINNNLMNETFGIAKDRYTATPEQLKKINQKKAELKAKARKLGLGSLDDEELQNYISPSWKEDFSRESMIIRKIRNNIVKKIPKDFGSSLAQETYTEATNDEYRMAKNEIIEHTAAIEIEPIAENSLEIPSDGEELERDSIIEPMEKENTQRANDEVNLEGRQKPNFD